jgi:hypothetical protein
MSNNILLQLKGRLGEARRKMLELVPAANDHAESIKALLALSSISSVEDMDADRVLRHARELKRLRDRILEVSTEIQRLRKELGEG